MYTADNALDILIPIAGGIILFGLLVVFMVYFILLYKRKQIEYEWEKEQTKQLLLKTEIEIKEQTLSYVSRELHDNLGQIASLIKINLGMMRLEDNSSNHEKLNDSKSLIKGLILDIKSLSTTLKGENLQRFGLVEMIKKDLKRLEKISHVKFKLICECKLPDLSSEVQVFLYRMTQEVFNNVLQHAEATEAQLFIYLHNSKDIEFKFVDNGKGFDINTNQAGNGLVNLEERCELIKANLRIKSEVGLGTEIQILLKNNE
jgi:two-component system NarL family sensor kinase